MNEHDIDHWRHLYSQRLRSGQAVTVAEFLEEHGLPPGGEIASALQRLTDETVPAVEPRRGVSTETVVLAPEEPKRGDALDETTGPMPHSLTGTAMWSIDRTLDHLVRRADVSMTTSIKTPVAAAPGSETTLFIQQRSVKPPEAAPHHAADYDLLNVLGKGGMGVVYAARQKSLDRTVAVKMLKPKGGGKDSACNEFLSEACVTGELEHPNIVPIYDLGRNAEGDYFYAMKRVQGTPWKDALPQKSLPENLEILLRVCDAVAFAHSKGIVHRDLKPENIMLGDYGEVLVMDWGLAIPIDRNRTLGGIRVTPTMGGTPTYMAPEMAVGPFEKIGIGSDIYLLGGILYEITTGLRPHTGKDVRECMYHVSRNVIQTTDKQGELIDIALRAMAFEPEDRFPSVKALQDAIREYLEHSESVALSTLAAERLKRAQETSDFQDYNRALFGFQQAYELWTGNTRARAGIAESQLEYAQCAMAQGDFELAAGLLDLAIPQHVALHQQVTAAKAEREARQQRLRIYKRLGIGLALAFVIVVTVAAIWIDHERAIAVKNEGIAKDERKRANRERDEARFQKTRAEQNEALAEQKRDEAEANRILAEQNEALAIQARRAEAYEAYVARIGAADAKLDENAFDGARKLLDECIPSREDDEDHRHWEWGRLRFLCDQATQIYSAANPLECLAVAYDESGQPHRLAAAGSGGKLTVWQRDGRPLFEVELAAANIQSLAFSPDGRTLAAATTDPERFIQILDAESGTLLKALGGSEGHVKPVLSVEYSADGARLLSSSEDGTAKIWDWNQGTVLANLHGHRWWVWQARYWPRGGATGTAPAGERIVTVSHDGTAIVWSEENGKWLPHPPFRGHKGPVYAAAIAPDGQTIATAGHDQRILLWNVADLKPFNYEKALQDPVTATQEAETPARELRGHAAPVRGLNFSRSGRILVSAGHDNTLRIWNAEQAQPLKTLRGHGEWIRACLISPGGESALTASLDRTMRIWDIQGYEEARVLRSTVLRGHRDAVLHAAFSSDGNGIVTASRDRTIRTWDLATGDASPPFREGHAFLASRAAFSNDGRLVATAAVDSTVRLWDVRSGSQLRVLTNTGRGAAVAVSADGRLVLTGGPELREGEESVWLAQVWNVDTGQPIHQLRAHTSQVTVTAISPDGKLLFTGDLNGHGILWDSQTGALIRRLDWHTSKLIGARFTSDQRHLLTASVEKTVARWDLATGEVDNSRWLKHPADLAAFDADGNGKFVVTYANDHRIRLWDADSAMVVREFPCAPDTAGGYRLALSPDARYLITIRPSQRVAKLYDVTTGEEIAYPRSRTELGAFLEFPEDTQVWFACFTPDSQQVVAGGGDLVRIWSLDREQLQFRRQRIDLSPHGVVIAANYSTDGREIVSGSWDGTAIIWDARLGASRRKLTGAHAGRVQWAVFSPDAESRYVLTASDDRTAILWERDSGRFLRRFVGHTGPVLCAQFAPDLSQILTCSEDGTVRIWDIERGAEPVRVLRGHQATVRQAQFFGDGKRVVSGSEDNLAIIWNLESGEPEFRLPAHTAPVVSVAVSPDGRRVLTGSEDFSAKLWDARTGKELLTLRGHEREVTSVSFSRDGRLVLTASHDGTAIVRTAAPWGDRQP